MADLGAIGFFAGQFAIEPDFDALEPMGLPTPEDLVIPAHTNITMLPPTTVLYESDGLDYLCEGIVSVLGTPIDGYLVRAFRRDTGGLLGQAISDALGGFSIIFNGFNGEVTCIAYDEYFAPRFNAVIFDRVIPVIL